MYSFLQYDTATILHVIIGTILFFVALVIYLKEKNNDEDSFDRKSMVVAMTLSIVVLILGGRQLQDENARKYLTVQQAYSVEKEGDVIQFNRILSNESLKNKVTVRVIGETDDQYQVEYNGHSYQINKSDVSSH